MAIIRGTYNIDHLDGDAYIIQFSLIDYNEQTDVRTPVDITNVDLLMQIRTTPESATVLYAPVLEKVDPTNGIFRWNIKPSVSAALRGVNGVYDIQMRTQNADDDAEQVITFLSGSFRTTSDVSRPTTFKVTQQGMPDIDSAIEKARLAAKGRR